MVPVVAHMFWDELLMFVVPVLLVLAAVRWAEKRRPEENPDDPTRSVDPAGNVHDESTHDGGTP